MENKLLYIEYVMKHLLISQPDLFGEKSKYVSFRVNKNYSWKGAGNSNFVFGQIEYTNGENDKIQLSEPLAVKIMPLFKALQSLQIFSFSNEIFFFTKMLPLYLKLNESVSHLFPKFYAGCVSHGSMGNENAAIIFDNLQAKNYRSSKRKSFLDMPHLRLMMKKIGQFHAYFYKLKSCKHENNVFFTIPSSAFVQTNLLFFEKNPNVLQLLGKRGLEPLLDDPIYCSKVDKIQDILKNAAEFYKKLLTGEKKNSISVLCHGDYLVSNIMFLYNDKDKPIDLKIIDLASCTLASPVIDLATVLYLNADQNTRNQYFYELIDEYYTALKETFPQNDQIPSKENIIDEFRVKSFSSYIVASYFLNQTIAEDEKLKSWQDFLPAEYKNLTYSEVPVNVCTEVSLQTGGLKATEALSSILKDMMERNFI